MKKVAFYTLGCKVNQYETEAITGLFEKNGYETVDFESLADVYVINTCTVTNLSDRKSRQIIRRAKKQNPHSVVVVVGCYAQTAPEEVAQIPGVNLIVGTKERLKIIEYIDKLENKDSQIKLIDNIMKARDFEKLNIQSFKERTRAYLKIQEGCSQFCAYCIIPYARGPVRSRLPQEVVSEVRRLSDAGFKEIVLTGIHLASYGKDIKESSIVDIIERIHEVEGIERIRLGSIEPTTITDKFVKAAKELYKLCPHYHISLQSGCDETLKRMNRKYTAEEFKKGIERLRAEISDVALTTDIMVGFPGETQEEFEETYKFLEEIKFSKMHVFKYSPRRGTPAAKFENQVDSIIKEERSRKVLELSDKNTLEFNKNFLNREMNVLIEQEVKGSKGIMEGTTSNYIRVLCKCDYELKGKIVSVKLKEAAEDYIVGELCTNIKNNNG